MKIIDTHAHLNFPDYDADRQEVISRMLAENIGCINVGVDFKTSQGCVDLAEKHNSFYAAVGLHPTDVDEPLDIEKFRTLAASKKVVAIGEIGLDFFRKPYDEKKQEEIFLQQLELAKSLDLPLIIHCRAAHDRMIELLEGKNMRGVIHCFTGTLEQAKKYVDLGFCLGIGGIMFKFNIDKVVQEIPLEKLLLETDCPFLTPSPAVTLAKAGTYGPRNEPAFAKYTAQKIAELREVSLDEVIVKTTENAKALFRI